MIVYSLNLRTTVIFSDYQIQKLSQNVTMSSTQITRSYGNHRRGSRDSIDSGDESDYEDSDDEESNRKRISRRHKKKRVKSRIPDYDEFARFRDSSRPPDSHYTSVKPSSSSSDKASVAPQEPSAPSEEPSGPNEEPAPQDEESNTKK
ncbi:unnamed protein product [Arctia plantaginis]|uniref:Uncharacterized protein n=1 Tax=Arctia plantaginis TaxID=874455 RepID=A0A8S0ZYP6_ARCPL|nr:unnamed protein product [Arctia plantaginis]CAB3238668.1 unnamed protein product [Arctia plantaginis]